MRTLLTVIAVVTATLGVAFLVINLAVADVYIPVTQDSAAAVEQINPR